MAGAVSAGAYTGGVLDYLLQTLDAWQQQKTGDDPRVPVHTISIDIISGASAGGITGAIAALALHKENATRLCPANGMTKHT
jgi:predicted acylesterase/phospholipase RssA